MYTLDNFFPEPAKSIVATRIAQYIEKEAVDLERADVRRQIVGLLQPGVNMLCFQEKVN